MRAQVRAPAHRRVVFDGQSLNLFPVPPLGTPMPELLMATYEHIPVPWEVVAVGDTGWFELIDTFNARTAPQARPRGGDILILNGGQSDFYETAHTPAQIYTDLTAYVDAARAVGFDQIVITTLPDMGPNLLVPEPRGADMAAYRDLVVANTAGADAVVDLFVPPLDDATDLTFFFADRVHVTTAGAQAMADLIAPALDDLLEAP